MAGPDSQPGVTEATATRIVVHGSEYRTGTYIGVAVNPNQETFNSDIGKAQHTILDIGCGEKPRLSWKLNALDMWVGCDPAISRAEGSVMVQRGKFPVSTDAHLALFNSVAADVPAFKPDILSAVAPNQKDIAEGEIFNDELKKFLTTDKDQTFVIVLDTRTHESRAYQRDAKVEIYRWMRENGFARNEESAVMDKFKANSADLGESNVYLVFTKSKKPAVKSVPTPSAVPVGSS